MPLFDQRYYTPNSNSVSH
uniref:Uncharacterized protein n=1 Tax=Arundo donax TaxID=35708 RepID=A0A0A8YS68_ARUDO